MMYNTPTGLKTSTRLFSKAVSVLVLSFIIVFCGMIATGVAFAEENGGSVATQNDPVANSDPQTAAPGNNTDAAASIGDVEYATLQEALEAATDNDTVKVLKDLSVNVSFITGDGMTIDLNGHTLRPEDKSKPVIFVDRGNDITIKNGTIAGSDTGRKYLGAVHTYSKKATISNVTFQDNGGCALSTFQDAIYAEDIEDRQINIDHCDFYRNALNGDPEALYTVNIVGYSAYFDQCLFQDNRNVLSLIQYKKPGHRLEFEVKSSGFYRNKGQVIETIVPSGSDFHLYGCNVQNNEGDGSREAMIKFPSSAWSETDGNGTKRVNYCDISNNKGYKYTIDVESTSMTMLKTKIKNNTAENAGAIRLYAGYLEASASVVTGNRATSDDDKSAGGIVAMSLGTVTHTGPVQEGGTAIDSGIRGSDIYWKNGGAIYGNEKGSSELAACDIYAHTSTFMMLPEVSAFDDEDKSADTDFGSLTWIDESNNSTFDSYDGITSGVKLIKVGEYADTDDVFIDGIKGNDADPGTRTNPVKTIEAALKIAKAKGADVIYVLDNITIREDGDEERVIDLEGRTLMRDAAFTGVKDGKDATMLTIRGGTKVLIKNSVIDGGSRTLSRTAAKSPLIMADENSRLTLGEGTVIQNNGTASFYTVRSGGGIYSKGRVIMEDGSVVRNSIASYGGGIFIYGGSLEMLGGVIENNKAVSTTSDDANEQGYGGGVCLSREGTMKMSGGTIRGNHADYDGGGISLGILASQESKGVSLDMSDGRIENNTVDGAGGGIMVQCCTVARITGGYIVGNRASERSGDSVFTGGGIYVNGYHADLENALGITHGKLYLENVEIARNEAEWEGGAIAICAAGHGAVRQVNGTVIYDNKANGKGKEWTESNVEGGDRYNTSCDLLFDDVFYEYDYRKGKWVRNEEGKFTTVKELPYKTTLSTRMISGDPYNWKNMDGTLADENYLKNIDGLTRLKTDATAADSEVKASVAMAAVHITDNYAGRNGGGIGCNGELYIGTEPEEVKEAFEEPSSGSEKSTVLGAYEDKRSEVKGASADGSDTGDDSFVVLAAMILLMAAATAFFALRRRTTVRMR